MPIQILPLEVVNQIAAGEVLERPANLIKELVENSLDAGAKNIEVDMDQGGRWICVQDDGQGMSRNDLKLSLQRHATSKIQNFSDLWSLSTFGFRGEALASSAAVSQLKIVTRPKKSDKAFQLKSKFGSAGTVQEVGGDYGTQIVVDRLFENVPARLKFMKSDSAETTQINRTLKAIALANPHVSFKIKQKGQLKAFYGKSDSTLNRVQQVLGNSEMFDVTGELDDLNAHIVFSSPKNVTRTSQNIWIFFQGRWIQDRAIQRAVLDAYRNLLMHGEYPYGVIYLTCDPTKVDVNIHPTKSQVKYQNASNLFRVVHNTLRSELERAPWLGEIFKHEDVQQNLKPIASPENIELRGDHFQTTQFKQKSFYAKSDNPSSQPGVTLQQLKNLSPKSPLVDSQEQNIATESITYGEQSSTDIQPYWGQLQVLGQLNQTYILAQSRSSLLLVDQHASHERVVFEKLMTAWKGGHIEVQTLLIPVALDLEEGMLESLLNFTEELKCFGVSIEQSGPNSVSVTTIPTMIKENSVVEVLNKIAKDALETGGSYALEKSIGDVFATMACHSVVRAGQALSHEEMQELLVQMDEHPLSSFCPHGRPVYKEYSFRELDREFGRIV